MPNARKVIAIVTDLMFIAKIQDGAKRAGVAVEFAKGAADTIAKAKQAPAVIVLDLNTAGLDVVETIRALKSAPETSGVKLLGFVSHIASEVIRAARETGCDRVVARSAFSQNLSELLAEYVDADRGS